MQKQIVRNESMRTVIRYAFWLLSLFLMSEIQAVTPQKAPLKLGAERMDVVTRLLKDKQVGLVVNQTSILEKQQKHLLDALLEEGINIKKVFAPEHGFRGTADAGAEIKDSRDVKTGVPIYPYTERTRSRQPSSWPAWTWSCSTFRMSESAFILTSAPCIM